MDEGQTKWTELDGMDKNGLLNGQWTMDDGRWIRMDTYSR